MVRRPEPEKRTCAGTFPLADGSCSSGKEMAQPADVELCLVLWEPKPQWWPLQHQLLVAVGVIQRSDSIDDYRKLIECLEASGIVAGLSVRIESCSPDWVGRELQSRRLPITMQSIQRVLLDPIHVEIKPYRWRSP
jgi:hypothetical protein